MKIFIYSRQREISQIIADNLAGKTNHCIVFEKLDDLSSLIRSMPKGPDMLILDYCTYNHELFNVYAYLKKIQKQFPVVFYNDPCITRSTRAAHWKTILELTQNSYEHKDFSIYDDIFEKLEELIEKDNVHCIEIPLPIDSFQRQFERLLARNEDLQSLKKNTGRRLSILLVDDDPVCLRNMMSWLQNFYQVAVAKSGAACLSFLGKTKPDLILLDYEMPVCNGLQTLEMIRNEPEYADIPVVFLTGVSDTEKVREAIKLKPQGYILKNTDRVEFLNKIKAVFGE